MLENILTQYVQPKTVEWVSPTKINLDLGDEKGLQSYELQKGASTFLHKTIDIKLSTSKDLYKKEQNIWKNLIDCRLSKCADNPNPNEVFTFDKPTLLYLITNNNELVDIVDFANEELLEEFKTKHKKLVLDISTTEKTDKWFQDSKNGLIKLVMYKHGTNLPEQEYTPIIVLELNNEQSTYKVYEGIFMYNTFTFLPSLSCDIEAKRLSEFINFVTLDESLERATEQAPELYESYLSFQNNPVEISARELVSLLKKVGCKLELDDLDKLHPIEAISDEENNLKLQNFFNTFTFTTGETAMEILQLSELKKTFRYNKITLLDALAIISKEYLTYDGSKITVDLLGDIIYKLYDSRNVDKVQAESIKNEVK